MSLSNITILPSPPVYFSTSAFDRLPNHGVYSIRHSLHPPPPPVRPSISKLWKTSRSEHFRKRGTLEFLKETQLYIETIRKPPLVEVDDRILTAGKKVKRKKPLQHTEVARKHTPSSYALKYFGDVNGNITMLTTRLPLAPQPISIAAISRKSYSTLRLSITDLSTSRREQSNLTSSSFSAVKPAKKKRLTVSMGKLDAIVTDQPATQRVMTTVPSKRKRISAIHD